MDKNISANQVSQILGLTQQRVVQLAKSRHVGKKINNRWLFDDADVDAMKIRIWGRPAKA